MKKIKQKIAAADLNLQWLMWTAILIMILTSLFMFRDQIMDFLTASRKEVTSIYTGE